VRVDVKNRLDPTLGNEAVEQVGVPESLAPGDRV
jgi:hypothetical protein